MPSNVEALTFTLQKPVSAEALRLLRDDAARAVSSGATALAVDVDDVGILDSQVISTLIAILRDVRRSGASVELRASRKSILDTLRITALDKVFVVTEPAAGTAPATPVAPPRRKKAVAAGGRLVASVAVGAFAAASILGAHTVPPTGNGSQASAAAQPRGGRTAR